MDTVEFAITAFGDRRHPLVGVEPVINGVPLKELARVAELPGATADKQPSLAGSYAGIAYSELLWPSRHYLGEPQFGWFDDGDTVLLGCVCGEYGCWPLTAIVDVDDTSVRWSRFRNGHRDWDLSALGPFTFSRDQYERALSAGP